MEVILVHGLWYGSWAMAYLARRLRRDGYVVRQFVYQPTKSPVAAHARQLARFLRQSSAATVHCAGHSLGGLVIMHMLAHEPGLPAGRTVLLGAPLQGSRVARSALQLPGGAMLFGRVADDLCHGRPQCVAGREIGMIAGSKALGAGRLFGRQGVVSDGTVGLCEADAPGLTGRVVLPVSHTGMLFSSQVAGQVRSFLQSGHFSA